MRFETVVLEGECQRLQLLVGELLLKNHQLRCEVARLREALDAKAIQAKKVQMPPPSVVTLKPAICGQFKTGHRDWPKT
jgi:regulator of replication initiation timing